MKIKILNARSHGMIDYGLVAILWLSPTVFNLSAFISTLVYGAGGVHLLLTLLTRNHYSAFDIIPLKFHSVLEFVVGVVLLLSPSVLAGLPNVNTTLDQFFLGAFGFLILVIWALTDYTE